MTTQQETVQQEALEAEFKPEQIRKVQGFDYIPVGDVIRRMNNVLGVGNWSAQIVSERYFEATSEVVVHVQVTAEIDGNTCSAPGFGGAGHNNRGLGDQYKSAASDALKKACQRLGVGLHLAVDDIVEDRTPLVDAAAYENLGNFVKSLNDEQRAEIAGWWKEYGTEEYSVYGIDAETWSEYAKFVRSYKEQPEQVEMTVEAVAEQLGAEIEGG